MKAYERFLKYVAVWTASDENSKSVPTTKRQLDLGALLVEEMKALGLSDVKMDEYGYVSLNDDDIDLILRHLCKLPNGLFEMRYFVDDTY